MAEISEILPELVGGVAEQVGERPDATVVPAGPPCAVRLNGGEHAGRERVEGARVDVCGVSTARTDPHSDLLDGIPSEAEDKDLLAWRQATFLHQMDKAPHKRVGLARPRPSNDQLADVGADVCDRGLLR